jgi:H+/Cl- antiporter ClcA
MSRVLDIFLTGFMNTVDFFENLRESPRDDPVIAEYKAKQRSCLWSFLAIAGVLLVGFAAGTVLNAFDGFKGAQSVVTSYRDWLATGFAFFAALSVLYAMWTWVALFRFTRQHGTN